MNILTRRAITGLLLAAAFLTLALPGWAQNPEGKERIPTEKSRKVFPLDGTPGGLLTIEVNGHGDHGVIVISPQSATGGAADAPNQLIVRAWEIQYNESAGSDPSDFLGAKSLQGILAVPDEYIKFNAGRLTIIERGGANQRGVVHVTVPSSAEGDLVVNGKLLYSGSLKNGLALENGRLNAAAGNRSASEALGLALTTPLKKGMVVQNVKKGTVIPPSGFGTAHTVAWETLKERAVESPASPPMTTQPQTSGCPQCSWAVVKLSIDQAGQMTNVVRLSGDEGISRAAAENL